MAIHLGLFLFTKVSIYDLIPVYKGLQKQGKSMDILISKATFEEL